MARQKIPFKTRTPPGVTVTLPKATPVAMKIKARESDLPPGREGFLTWLYNSFPAAYSALEARAPQVLSTGPIGFGDADPTVPGGAQAAASTTPAWIQTVQNIALPLMQIYQQKKVIDLQLKRAQAGKRPLDIADYMGDASIRTGLDSSTQKTLLIAVGIIGAFIVLPKLLRARP
jgi:hypothetical protein